MGVQPPPYDPWQRDADSGWHAITITCILILLVCGGLGLLLFLARHTAEHRNPPAPPVPVSTTHNGTLV